MSDSLYDGRDEETLREAGRYEIIQKLGNLRRETLLAYDPEVLVSAEDYAKVVDRLISKSVDIVDTNSTVIAFVELTEAEKDKHGAGIAVWGLAEHYMKHVSN